MAETDHYKPIQTIVVVEHDTLTFTVSGSHRHYTIANKKGRNRPNYRTEN